MSREARALLRATSRLYGIHGVPSTGWIAAAAVLPVLCANTTLYGFGSYLEGHYWEFITTSARHDMPYE
eukprot:scaffold467179_cov55-Prasinocladus_malaysianus.AAC.1